MIRVIIESPYAPFNGRTVQQNVDYARECMMHSLSLGEAPIASHLLYTQDGILDDTDLEQRQLGIMAGYQWMDVAQHVVFYTDHGWTPGMLAAYTRCLLLSIPVQFRALQGEIQMPPPVE